jgi:hypothetical protein
VASVFVSPMPNTVDSPEKRKHSSASISSGVLRRELCVLSGAEIRIPSLKRSAAAPETPGQAVLQRPLHGVRHRALRHPRRRRNLLVTESASNSRCRTSLILRMALLSTTGFILFSLKSRPHLRWVLAWFRLHARLSQAHRFARERFNASPILRSEQLRGD